MRYFKQEDFDKCMKFLEGKPETIETQQELYKFMHDDCRMLHEWSPVAVKNMRVYSKVYFTANNPTLANWCATMSDGSQVVWNRKYREFYGIDEVGVEHCSYLNYSDLFVEIKDIDEWLLENWSDWRFRETQKQLIAIWNGKYDQYFRNYFRNCSR